MESHLYLLWQVDIRNSVKNDLFIVKEYHIQPSEILRMPYYQYEWILDDIREEQKKLEEQRKQEELNRKDYKIPKIQTPKLPTVRMPRF